ncbi:MAG: M1 family metallopeptidase [Bacteroidota bacterium]|nr:M1 family metallopeptidase [Bacteroidota bacterium]MDP4229055.1 M1 family metallopeptidase [Bacteroidota bacterium]MDP4235423.1 M1 family metallopeptidase [Bacteroidota bacterium]
MRHSLRSVSFLAAIILLSFTHPASAQPPILYQETHLVDPAERAPREHPVDMLRMKIEVSFDCPKGIVYGKVTHYFTPLRSHVDSIFFDGPGIKIKDAMLNGKPLQFTTDASGVTVFPGKALSWGENDSITFVYEATPRKGIYFIGWNDPRNLSRKQIWTQGEGTDNRYWIPCYDDWDDKLITETIVKFDKEYKVLSNGTKLSEKDNGDGTKTWHYRMTHRHSAYLVMLGIGKYEIEQRKTKAGVPVNLYYYPEHPEYVQPTYKYATECIDFVAKWTGIPYPWESYSNIPVQDFIYGAMENTTATIYGDFFLNDARGTLDRGYFGVDVHELTHQWFGDLITIRNGPNMWLHESHATFFPKLFTREVYGEDAYEWNRRGEHNAMVAANDGDRFPIVHTKAGGSRIYPGGSAVIGMMLYTFGEEEMRHVYHYYLSHHMYSNVETNDLYQAFQDTLGLSPDWFFEQWLYRGGVPEYTVSYQDIAKGSGHETEIDVAQTQHIDDLTRLFKMPIVFEVHYTDGSMDSKREWIEKERHIVSVPNPSSKQIAFVLFDPGDEVVKKINFKKPFSELKAQALGAPKMLDRYDAVVSFRTDSVPMEQKRDALIQVYNKETYQAIRGEIVGQLAADNTPESRAIIRRALKDTTLDVRSAALNAYRFIPQDIEPDVAMLLKDSSYNMVSTALDKLCESFPQNTAQYLDKTKDEDGMSHKVHIKWLEIKASSTQDAAALKQLVDYVSVSYEFITRQTAMDALSRLNYFDNDLLANLINALLSTNNRLAGSANGILTKYYGQTQFRNMMMAYYKSKTWEPWQKEIIDRIIK